MPKIPNPFDRPEPRRKKPTPRKDPKPRPYGDYGQGLNIPRPSPRRKKPLRAGVDTRPTERDSQTKQYKYGPPRTARDIELAPRPRPRPKSPRRPAPKTGYQPYLMQKPKLERRRKKLSVYKPKKGA